MTDDDQRERQTVAVAPAIRRPHPSAAGRPDGGGFADPHYGAADLATGSDIDWP